VAEEYPWLGNKASDFGILNFPSRDPRLSQPLSINGRSAEEDSFTLPRTRCAYHDAMDRLKARDEHNGSDDNEETRSLLSDSSSDIVAHSRDDILPKAGTPTPSQTPSLSPSPTPGYGQRHSSLAQPRPDGAPRTPNRVRFDIDDRAANGHVGSVSGGPRSPESGAGDWMDEEDYMTSSAGRRNSGGEQRLPLLTGIEAPSVTVASSDMDFSPEDLLESARPKSGMNSAFMNMANSIM
jgi:solute carrier family 38 (sodium-coupled neutral amino acid transporter), member 11